MIVEIFCHSNGHNSTTISYMLQSTQYICLNNRLCTPSVSASAFIWNNWTLYWHSERSSFIAFNPLLHRRFKQLFEINFIQIFVRFVLFWILYSKLNKEEKKNTLNNFLALMNFTLGRVCVLKSMEIVNCGEEERLWKDEKKKTHTHRVGMDVKCMTKKSTNNSDICASNPELGKRDEGTRHGAHFLFPFVFLTCWFIIVCVEFIDYVFVPCSLP